MKTPLSFLTEGDWRLLRARSVSMQYARDEVIVREGAESRGFMIIESGSAHVEHASEGMTVILTRIARGECFGEMSLLEETTASASVVADEPTTVELFERAHVTALLESDPGLSARFHRSIAVDLSRRLRERSRALSTLKARSAGQVSRFHATRLGQITTRQLSKDLVDGVAAFKAKMAAVDARPAASAQAQVDAACTSLIELLQRSTTTEALFEMSYNDLGSFRDQDQVAVGVGAYVFRETFSWFMSAATVARYYMKPRGFPEDFETLGMVYADEPEGDGAVGPLIDRWYLSRPVCRARREGREQVRALVRRIAGEKGGNASIASLASGSGREAIELCAEPALSSLRVTCVDLDPDALFAGTQLSRGLRVAGRVAFVRADVLPSSDEAAPIGRQDVVYALGLLEYLSDEQCVRVLNAAFDALVPGGTFAATTLTPDNADRAFMTHILEWSVTQRSAGDLQEICGRSRFAGKSKVEALAGGAGLLFTASRS